MTDPTNATRDARALIVAHGAAQAIDAIASVLIRLGGHYLPHVRALRDVASDIRAEDRAQRRAAWVNG